MLQVICTCDNAKPLGHARIRQLGLLHRAPRPPRTLLTPSVILTAPSQGRHPYRGGQCSSRTAFHRMPTGSPLAVSSPALTLAGNAVSHRTANDCEIHATVAEDDRIRGALAGVRIGAKSASLRDEHKQGDGRDR